MSPDEAIYFLLLGIIVFTVMMVIWFIFRKRKKVALTLCGMLMIGYIGTYLYFPTYKANVHEKRYTQLVAYLDENYPNTDYNISPKVYEQGIGVGEFYVNTLENPDIGTLFLVHKDGQVTQKGRLIVEGLE